MHQKTTYHAIGLMSGSSLDGLDICAVNFFVETLPNTENVYQKDTKIKYSDRNLPMAIMYEITNAACVDFNDTFRERLRSAPTLNAFEFARLHTEVGKYFGELTNAFIQNNNLVDIDFIASHGQTIFHQPKLGFTSQIGCGAQIAVHAHAKSICDFRTADVAYGGQGAPLVPIVERQLFPQYQAFLNIGGICNISLHHSDEQISGYDICAGNTLLNHFARKKNMPYDDGGRLAKSGKVIPELLDELNLISFCLQSPPKSLGSEHVYADWIACCEKHTATIEDILATCVEHIAIQTGNTLRDFSATSSLLVTGGGALHTFLKERIQAHTALKVVVPDLQTIQYKEALLMAFCGLLRELEIPNSIKTVTGASKNAIGGAIYLP